MTGKIPWWYYLTIGGVIILSVFITHSYQDYVYGHDRTYLSTVVLIRRLQLAHDDLLLMNTGSLLPKERSEAICSIGFTTTIPTTAVGIQNLVELHMTGYSAYMSYVKVQNHGVSPRMWNYGIDIELQKQLALWKKTNPERYQEEVQRAVKDTEDGWSRQFSMMCP